MKRKIRCVPLLTVFLACVGGLSLIILGCSSVSGSLIDNTARVIVDCTEWLDFQRMSNETNDLFAKDRIGKTKCALLEEVAKVEYDRQIKMGYNDCLRISVMFPSNVAENVVDKIRQASSQLGGLFDARKIREHFHGMHNESSWGKWKDDESGFEIRVFAREWQLVKESDFDSFLYSLSSIMPRVGVSATMGRNEPDVDLVRVCLRESCCWVLYTRRRIGANLQFMGCRWYDSLVVEFDSSGKVVKQRQISWGVGDG